MKILMISKFRTFQGGVETHIDDLMRGLKGLGHQVEFFSSEDFVGGAAFDVAASNAASKVRSVSSMFWNARARQSLQRVIQRFKPDILHYHSIYHQLSPSVLDVTDLPSVMTLHDFKMVAPCYSLFREGKLCTECVGKTVPYPAVRHRCVKDSVLASSVCASEQILLRGRYKKAIHRFIVPSDYLRKKLVLSGFESEQMQVVPWGVPSAKTPVESLKSGDTHRYLLFAGRLHESKGIEQLLEAWTGLAVKNDVKLVIAGGGALEGMVRSYADRDESIVFRGVLPRRDLLPLLRGAGATIVPSIFPETMGLTAVESLVAGSPLIATSRGALEDLRGPGVIFVDADDLVSQLRIVLNKVAEDVDYLDIHRQDLAQRDLSGYSSEAMVRSIMATYTDVYEEYRSESRH